MNEMSDKHSHCHSFAKRLGLFIIRVGFGILFIVHGYPNLIAGPTVWASLGSTMSLLGITFAPAFWGFGCVVAEFFGGIFLTVGLFTRIVSVFMALDMVLALMYHINKGDPFMVFSNPLKALIVFVGLMLMGGGKLSLDRYLCKKRSAERV